MKLAHVTDGIRCPQCEAETTVVSGNVLSCISCKARLADWLPDEQRLQYDYAVVGVPEDMQSAVLDEEAEWDAWATKRVAYAQRTSDKTFGQWLGSNRTYRQVIKRYPAVASLAGARVLDIGGTCTESIMMLRSGTARLDQLEVSAISQHLAIKNLNASGLDWEGRVFFHTIPAERLPFCDGTFDMVFAHATIHHVRRPDVWGEIHRVLRTGGMVFLYEAWAHHWLVTLMPFWRRIRGVAGGTDKPLSTLDIRAMERLFTDVWHYPFGFLSRFWAPSLGRVKPFNRLTGRVRSIEFLLGNALGLCDFLGHICIVVATKPPRQLGDMTRTHM